MPLALLMAAPQQRSLRALQLASKKSETVVKRALRTFHSTLLFHEKLRNVYCTAVADYFFANLIAH